MNTTVSIAHSVEALSYDAALSEANTKVGRSMGEISDPAALALTRAFQIAEPGWPALAALASGVEVDVDDVLDSIRYIRRESDPSTREHVALDMLATWALNR